MFLATLQIMRKVMRCAIEKVKAAGVVPEDRRGKTGSRNKLSNISMKLVVDHLDSFPKVESHYTRKSSKKLYIEDTSNF